MKFSLDRLSGLALALFASWSFAACHDSSTGLSGQILRAEGQVFALDGTTALPNLASDSYSIFFKVAQGIEMGRTYREDDETTVPGIQTDLSGLFNITADRLGLSYSYETDPYLSCSDVCVAWDQQCYTYQEDVCTTQCESVPYTRCETSCWDNQYCETYTDEDGNPYEECWTEQECSEDCFTDYREECWEECTPVDRERCEDVCVETVEECHWRTDTITVPVAYDEIESVRTELKITDSEGVQHTVVGQPLASRQNEECTVDPATQVETCEPINEWLQKDRFISPLAASAASGPKTRDSRIVLSKPAPRCKHTRVDQQNELSDEKMEKLRELRRILGIQPEQVKGRL